MVLVLTVIVVGAAIDTVVLSATVTAITITFAKKPAAALAAPARPTVAATFFCVILAVPLRLPNDVLTRICHLPETGFIRGTASSAEPVRRSEPRVVCAALKEVPSWLGRLKTNTAPALGF
jgi:hypothetical protein